MTALGTSAMRQARGAALRALDRIDRT